MTFEFDDKHLNRPLTLVRLDAAISIGSPSICFPTSNDDELTFTGLYYDH